MFFSLLGLAVLAYALGRWAVRRLPVRSGSPAVAPLPPPDLPQAEGRLPEWPHVVTSAAQVEPRAARERCAHCGAEVRVGAHEAVTLGGRRLRVVDVTCVRCGLPQRIWFRLEGPTLDA